MPWRLVISKDGLLVTLRKALRDSSRPQTREDTFPPGLGSVFTDLLVAELAVASYKLEAACHIGNTYDRMKKEVRCISVFRARCCSCHTPPVCKYRRRVQCDQVAQFNLLHEQNAFHWAELIQLSNALVASKEFMLEDQVAEMLADRSKRTSEALRAALTRREIMVWSR